jgi:hypothetical protein
MKAAANLDLDLEFHCGLFVLGRCLATGAYDIAHHTIDYLLGRVSGSGAYLMRARLWQAAAASYAGEQRWTECLTEALRAWSLFDDVRYRSGAPFIRTAVQALSRRSRHCALRASVALGKRRTVLQHIAASRLSPHWTLLAPWPSSRRRWPAGRRHRANARGPREQSTRIALSSPTVRPSS